MTEQQLSEIRDRAAALDELAEEPYCYLTTSDAATGKDHEVEMMFALRSTTVYLLATDGERAEWVRNIQHTPQVRLRIAGRELAGVARIIASDPQEDELARRLLAGKYDGWRDGMTMSEWASTALPVAVDLAE